MIFLQSPLKAQQYLQLALLVHDQTMSLESSHTYPQLADTMMCSKKTNDHGFGNELEAKYWLRLKFSFPPEASRPVHALSILNGRVPGSAIPLLYNMLCSANANIKAPLCSACSRGKIVTTTKPPGGVCSW